MLGGRGFCRALEDVYMGVCIEEKMGLLSLWIYLIE